METHEEHRSIRKPNKAVTESAILVTLTKPFIGCLKTPFHTCWNV